LEEVWVVRGGEVELDGVEWEEASDEMEPEEVPEDQDEEEWE